jgi:predicted Rossmann-fold nucleotide-binding protein
MSARFACAYVVLPGGFGTLDELFDALALIQARRLDDFPVILFDRRYWGGLVAWLRETVLGGGAIGRDDLALLSMVDNPAEVCAIALAAARRHASAAPARATPAAQCSAT